MKWVTMAALLLCPALARPLPPPETATERFSPLRPRYEIRAELTGREIRGSLRLRLHNATSHSLEHLVLHCHPEAFRRGSVFHAQARSPSAIEDPREVFPAPDEEGGLTVHELMVDGLPARGRAVGTLLTVPLAQPLGPGGELLLEASFVSVLPGFDWRSGWVDGLAFAGQWYPQLAAFDAARGRFETEEYHRFGEFQSDVADYEVELVLQPGVLAGASGVRTASGERHRYEARGFRDFAWVAGPYATQLEAAQAGVLVRVLTTRPEDKARELLEQTLAALEDLGRRYGRYPYCSLTVAETPISGGMEYPGIVFVGSDVIRAGGALQLEVVTHEVAHQWWAMLLGNDGLHDAWIDEGLATYTTAAVLDERLLPQKRGLSFPPPLRWLWPSLSFRERYLLEAHLGDALWPARSVVGAEPPWPDPMLYVTAVYSRAARFFFRLEASLGREGMDAWLRNLLEQHAYRRIGTDALLAEARNAGAPADAAHWLWPDAESWPRKLSFDLLGPFPRPGSFGIGLLPVFGGRGRDELVAGLRLIGTTPFAIRGLFPPFLALPRLSLGADVLRRLESGSTELLLAARTALDRRTALEARGELGAGSTLLGLELARIRGRSAFAGPFRVARAGLRWEDAPGFELASARLSLRLDSTSSLLVPRRGAALHAWAEAGRELERRGWAARAGVQAGLFAPLGQRGLWWGGLAAAAATDAHPRRLPVEVEGWLTAWPGTSSVRLASARLEALWQPPGAAALGLAVAGGWLDDRGEGRLQAGPALHLFGEMPFSVHLDLPLLTAGGPDAGFGWRWALRFGPRVGD
jgi:hypothetical protein